MSSVDTRNRLEAWVSFLRAHAAITRQLNADLLNAHGLTLSDYEVLLRLSGAENQMMRRVDLAESVLLTASGITRLLDGLERAGFVEKASCDSDARVSYAKLAAHALAADRARLRSRALLTVMRPRPVYWKPRYPSRRMRERAWAKGALPRTPSLLARLRARLGRMRHS
jgi:DNA-binding MarR family transcriptional regulator